MTEDSMKKKRIYTEYFFSNWIFTEFFSWWTYKISTTVHNSSTLQWNIIPDIGIQDVIRFATDRKHTSTRKYKALSFQVCSVPNISSCKHSITSTEVLMVATVILPNPIVSIQYGRSQGRYKRRRKVIFPGPAQIVHNIAGQKQDQQPALV